MNKAAKVIGVVVGSVFLVGGGCTIANMEYQRRAIPAKLATGMFYAEGSCGDWLSYQGAQVFTLKKHTIAALKSEGLHFFEDIGSPTNRAKHAYFGGKWQTTPIPDAGKSDGPLANMYCAMERSWRWPAGISKALQHAGGFYQTGGGRTLIVLPEQGYIVAVASDR